MFKFVQLDAHAFRRIPRSFLKDGRKPAARLVQPHAHLRIGEANFEISRQESLLDGWR